MNGSRAVRCHRCGTMIENLGLAGIMWGRPGVEPVLLRRPVILCKQECLQVIDVGLPWLELTRFLFKTEPERWKYSFVGDDPSAGAAADPEEAP